MPRHLRSSRSMSYQVTFILFFSVCIIHQTWAADTASIISVDKDKGVVTIRNNQTGQSDQIKIESVDELQSLKVGTELPKPDVVDVQTRAAQSPHTMSGKTPEQSCYQRCMTSPGTTIAQCMYWCGTR
jgi:hypothetical protein